VSSNVSEELDSWGICDGGTTWRRNLECNEGAGELEVDAREGTGERRASGERDVESGEAG